MAWILMGADDPERRNISGDALMRRGQRRLEAVKGGEALERVRTQATDLVLRDVSLPDKDGLAITRTLRRQHPRRPIVAISGGSSSIPQDFLPMAVRLGARRTLRQPCGPEEFHRVAVELLPGAG
jgi:CheY-like chemotaxis protein